ncbi:hypothetical protein V5E97_30905 [Singulisphaera sp. Ch08]|uniref:Uncharacterized protein n=1 Tax=Singulisphaera sp. Ch08 TaxID=3120278 RepID=A0AAU7CC44_9BACT
MKTERAGRIPDNLKVKAAAGDFTLYYLNECGFAPTLPVGYIWRLPNHRKIIRYEASQRRRVNAMAAYRPTAARHSWVFSRPSGPGSRLNCSSS